MGVYLGSKAVSVYNGGQMAPEEKTVTAGISPIEVNATSGKLMSKVTVNPTPTEEKTAIPTTEDLVVAPVEGKQLSQVTVQGDANFLEENIAEGITIWGKTGTHQGGGGDIVNGIVESYLANTETIDANNFVEFIKKIEIGDNYDSLITMNTSISNQNDCVSSKLNPTWGLALSNDKVLIIYKGISEYKGVFCRVDTNSISASTPFTFLQSTDYGTPVGIIQLDSNRFLLITLKYQSDFSYYNAYGVVGTINNESIVFGDFTKLNYI